MDPRKASRQASPKDVRATQQRSAPERKRRDAPRYVMMNVMMCVIMTIYIYIYIYYIILYYTYIYSYLYTGHKTWEYGIYMSIKKGYKSHQENLYGIMTTHRTRRDPPGHAARKSQETPGHGRTRQETLGDAERRQETPGLSLTAATKRDP